MIGVGFKGGCRAWPCVGWVVACAGLAWGSTLNVTGLGPAGGVSGAVSLTAWADEDPWVVVRSSAAPEAARLAAAQQILDAAGGGGGGGGGAAREQIERAIAGSLDLGSPGRIILQAMSRELETPLPSRMFAAVAERLARGGDAMSAGERSALISALGSFRTRESGRMLVMWLDERQPAEVVRAASDALQRLSGQPLGEDRDAWRAWYRSVEPLSEAEWRQRLISGLAKRAERSTIDASLAETRLADLTRKLYLATPADDRPAFLADLLRSVVTAERNLGFELVSRELASRGGGALNGPVGATAVSLLKDPSAIVRGQAAMLVRQLGPQDAGPQVLQALKDEVDAGAACELLLAAGRWPARSAEAAVTRWLPVSAGDSAPWTRADEITPVHRAAIEAAWMFFRAGELSTPSVQVVLQQLRRDGVTRLTPAGVQLLVAGGDESDWNAVAALLKTTEIANGAASLRRAAAEALVWYPEYRDDILRGAQHDVGLFEIAAQALWLGEPTAADLRRLLALPRENDDAVRSAVRFTAARMNALDIWEIAGEPARPGADKGTGKSPDSSSDNSTDLKPDPALDSALKRSLLDELTRTNRVMSESRSPEKMEVIARAAVLVAEDRLKIGQPDQAMGVLLSCGVSAARVDSNPPKWPGDPAWAMRADSVAISALVGIGKAADVPATQGDREAWARGWAVLPEESLTRAFTANEMLKRFPEGWNAEQRAALLAAANPPGNPAPNSKGNAAGDLAGKPASGPGSNPSGTQPAKTPEKSPDK
jgi:hypothetical protein